jgi:hypothetical protein
VPSALPDTKPSIETSPPAVIKIPSEGATASAASASGVSLTRSRCGYAPTSVTCTHRYKRDAASSDSTTAIGTTRRGACVSPAATGATSKPWAANSATNVAEPMPAAPLGSAVSSP